MCVCVRAYGIEVLDVTSSHQSVSRSIRSVLRDTVGASRVTVADGAEEDWAVLPLKRALKFLCCESPNFRGALLDLVRQSGLSSHMRAQTNYPM